MIVITKWTAGPMLLTVVLVIASLIKLTLDASWIEHWLDLVLLVLGAAAVLFTDRVAEQLEEERPHEEWFQKPNHHVLIAGCLAVLWFSNAILGVIG